MTFIELLIFVGVLVVLIVVHELGHFFAAKSVGMRVLEFGLGYPPKLFGVKKGDTEYTVNALPFGGFVRIFGEDGTEEANDPKAFTMRPKWAQAFVLLAGVAMNVLLAFIIFIVLFAAPTERALTQEEIPLVENAALAITEVFPGSPGDVAGLSSGDSVRSISYGSTVQTDLTVEEFIALSSKGEELAITVERQGREETVVVTPQPGVIPSDMTRPGLGVSLAMVGVLPLPLHEAILQATLSTWEYLVRITVGLTEFIVSAFTFSADLSLVAGPVGIATIVGDASSEGIAPLLFLSAIISLNLAVLNLLPFPALDGGRLLFVAIEAATRKKIPLNVAQTANTVGFFVLILLMVLVTASDIGKLLG